MKTLMNLKEKNCKFFKPTSMIEYSRRLKKKISSIIQPLEIKNSLGEILSQNNLHQLRITETENMLILHTFLMVD